MDYAIPRARMIPWLETSHTITPSPVNPLGVKGVGEAGTIGCSPALVNSVVDALTTPRCQACRYADDTADDLESHPPIRRPGMIAQQFEYSATKQLSEALALMANGAKPLAGGMSLVPMMKLRLATPEHVVDIRRIEGLRYIKEDGDRVRMGATATHHDVESSAVLHRVSPLLAKTAACIGDVQVRNMGTIGGSVAHNDPAADYLAALFALEAEITLASANGQRTLTHRRLHLDAFTTALEPGELLTRDIRTGRDAGTGTTYVKMSQPASGFAIVGIAVRVRRAADGKIGFIRIGMTGVGPTAYRATAAETKLAGTAASDADIAAAAALVAENIDANSDLNASAEFRKHLASTHAARAIRAALADITAGHA